jgi:hypothetical protein
MKKILFLFAASIILASCSQVKDMSDSGQVSIQLGQFDEGNSRFLADSGSKIIVAFLKNSDVYLYEEYNRAASTIEMNGIIEGDYVLLVLLLEEDDDLVSLGSKAVTISSGINYIDVTLGPGIWDLEFNGEDLDLTDLPSGFRVTVGENRLAFEVPASEINTGGNPEFTVQFKTNAVDSSFSLTSSESEEISLSKVNHGDYLDVTVGAIDGARTFKLALRDPQYNELFNYTISFH